MNHPSIPTIDTELTLCSLVSLQCINKHKLIAYYLAFFFILCSIFSISPAFICFLCSCFELLTNPFPSYLKNLYFKLITEEKKEYEISSDKYITRAIINKQINV